MRFRRQIVNEMSARLVQLGLNACAVCGSDSSLTISRLPVILSIGGFLHVGPDDPRHDPDTNFVYAVRVECEVCGHIMLFNHERFYRGDEPTLITGPAELEDQIDPPGSG